jgi:pimeloyl-ACP methyl ester carboxylesterase
MRTITCLIAVLISFGSVYAEPQIDSRTAKIDNVELHYLTAGHGPAVILLHGYAETSRMWRPLIPLLAEKFTVIAPDLPGIGDSSIPTDKIDMLTSANRIHALVRSLGVEKARVVGHDIGLMVAYAYATQFPVETEKLVVMDAFLPGVPGWEAIYNAPNVWHFRFNGRVSRSAGEGTGAHLLRIFLECFRRRQNTIDSGTGAAGLHRGVFEAGANAGSVGLFCVMAAARERLCATVAYQIDDAGALNRRRQIIGKRTRRANETGRDRCQGGCIEGHGTLDPGGAAERNNGRASEVSLAPELS